MHKRKGKRGFFISSVSFFFLFSLMLGESYEGKKVELSSIDVKKKRKRKKK